MKSSRGVRHQAKATPDALLRYHCPSDTKKKPRNALMKSIFAKAFAEAAILLTSHTLAAKTFAAFWSRVSPKLAEGVGYFEKHDGAGLEVDRTFLERITFRDPEITRIVDGCLKEFLHSDILHLIDTVHRIEEGIAARQEQINAWKLASIAAPSTSLSPLKATRAALGRRIERERQAIETEKKRIETLKADTLRRLSQDGIAMTAEQLDGILYSAEGSELAQVMAVAENIKAVEKNLSQALKGPDAGPEQIKAYTGFVMMSYRVYIEAVERAMKKIESVYITELAAIADEADTMMREADELTRHSAKTVEIAQNNLDINARTINLAQLYEDHLRERWAALDTIRREMRLNFALARNTFRTIKVGGELIDVIKAGQKDLESIFAFEPPQLEAFYDKELRREFDSLTARLKSK